MKKGLYIERREPEENLFHRLQQESVGELQRLSGELWADYNAHDPGVTILDQLNAALTELDYRFSFPLADYLTDPRSGEIPFARMGLLPFEGLFRGSVVTAGDYETLMTENLPGIAACRASFSNGRYDFVLYPVEGAGDPGTLPAQAARLYQVHRNLCETLGHIRIGETLPAEKKPALRECPEQEPPDGYRPVSRDVSAYHSVQADFPECYGLGSRGIPPGTPKGNRARIRQLQAYLLVFDHLLAGAGIQATGLFSKWLLSGDLAPDSWPEIDCGDAEKVIDREKRPRLPQTEEAFAQRQRRAWFDTLDSLYGEETGAVFASLSDPGVALEKRAALIRQLPYLNEIRFRSFDTKDSCSVTALRHWAAAVSGDEKPPEERPLANLFSRYRLKLVPDSLFFREYGTTLPGEFTFGEAARNWDESEWEPIVLPTERPVESDFQRLRAEWDLFRYPVLSESLILHGRSADNYRCVPLRDREGYLLVWQHPERKRWLNLGFFPTRAALVRAAGNLSAFLNYLHRACDTFCVVEHPLLYPDTVIPAEALHRVSILSPAWIDHSHDRDTYEDRLRERLPAHLSADFHRFPPDQWFYLEKLYFDWRKALAEEDPTKIKKSAEELRLYLQYM